MQHMSTTDLEVEFHGHALPSEQGALDVARHLPLGQENPITTSTRTIAVPAAEQLDLARARKLSEEISGEMVLERLIEKVLHTAIEHAGAQRGLLIVPRGEELRIEAEAMAVGDRVTVLLGENVNSTPRLPESVLRSVVRTQQAVLLDDAAAPNAFSADPYIARHGTRSILCLPLLNRSKLIALLYLENNLAADVFTSARITLLKAPASQVAAALENAQLSCELTESEAKFRRLCDSNIIGICTWDLDGRVLEANEMFLRLYGYERDDLISGRVRWTDFASNQERERDLPDRVARLQNGESMPPVEWELIRKDGSRVPLLTDSALFKGASQGVAFALDLTERKRVEQSLQHSEAHLAEAQRLTHTGSWIFNPASGKVTYWSDEMFRIYGIAVENSPLPYEELVRQTHPEDRVRTKEAFESAIRDKAEIVLDYRKAMDDGTVRYLQTLGHPVLDKTGTLVEYIGTLVDVTERKCVEQRLLVQYRVTRILAEAATVDEATPKILQAICECLGWDSGSLWRIDREAGLLRHAERWHAPSRATPVFGAAMRLSTFEPGSGIPGRVWASRAPIFGPDVSQDGDERYQDAAIREGIHSSFAFPILLGSEVLGVMGFVSRNVWRPDQDLLDMMATLGSQIGQFTKRTAAVDELQLQVSMLQNIPVAAWSIKPDGTPDAVNQLWIEHTGQTMESVTSHEVLQACVHPEDRERASRAYREGIRSGRGFTVESRLLRVSDGTYRWHLHRAVPVRDPEGNILRFVGTSTDVHDLRQAQEALRNTQTEFAHMTRVMTMGELTASIAHEVNQPLGAMVTSAAAGARWLATTPPQMDKARRALERIADDGKRAAEVIRRIRALMKRQAPRKEWLDLNEAILEVIALAQYQLRRSAILLETRLGHPLPSVRGDRVQLQQVLLNLIVNAIEAMSGIKERPRQLTIVSSSDGPDTVSVEVRDSGTGLVPAHAPRVFEAFYTTKPEGLGVGLSISLSIVEAHGGRLSAAANAPHGTVFVVSLPVNETAR